jgi:hypothetical protein
MSAATTDPAAGAAAGGGTEPGAGGTPIEPQVADSSSSASGQAGQGSQDYLGRIRDGGDFAASEVTKHQSRADKAEAENRRFVETLGGENGQLQQLLSQVDAETIVTAVNNYAAIRQHDKFGRVVQEYETTGQIPSSGTYPVEEEDEYLSPEQREIRDLKIELNKTRTQINGITTSTGTAALQGHLETFAKEHFLSAEEFETVKRAIEPQIKQWGTNDAGRSALQRLQTPDGYSTVKALGLQNLPESVIFELGDRKRLRERERLERHRTDGPSESSTTGREAPPEVKGALAALKYAKANPDRI